MTISSDELLSHDIVITYKCENQSIWNDHTTNAISASTGTLMYTKLGPIHASDSGYADLKILGTFGGGASLDADVRMGIRFDAHASLGSVDVNCPVRVKFSYPKYIPLVANQTTAFRVTTSYLVEPTATFSTYSPNVDVAMYAHADGNFNLTARAEAFSKDLLNVTIRPGTAANGYRFDSDQQLFDLKLTDLANAAASYIPMSYPSEDPTQGPIVAGDVNFPSINTSGARTDDGLSLAAEGSDSVLGLNVDITNLITYIVEKVTGIPMPLVNTLSFPSSDDKPGVSSDQKRKSAFKVELAYQLLDLYLRGELGVKQSFQFGPAPKVGVLCTDGRGGPVKAYRTHSQNADGSPNLSDPVGDNELVAVGTDLWFYMPPTGSVRVEPTLSYNANFSNKTYAYLSGGVHFDPLSLSISGDVAGISLPSFDFKPISLGDTASTDFLLCAQTPALSFQSTSYAAPPMSIVNANPPMAAIGSLNPAAAPAYNVVNPSDTNSAPQDLWVEVKTDKDPWPPNLSTNPRARFYWDNNRNESLDWQDVTSTANFTVRVRIPSDHLVPGVHTLTSEVQYSDSANIDLTQPLIRSKTVSFAVNHLQPAVQNLMNCS